MPTSTSRTGAPATAGAFPCHATWHATSIGSSNPSHLDHPSRDGSSGRDGSDGTHSGSTPTQDSPLLDSSKIRQESSKATIANRTSTLDPVTVTQQERTHAEATHSTTRTTSTAPQKDQHDHGTPSAEPTKSATRITPENSLGTPSRKQSRESTGSNTRNHTLASLPNRSVRPAGAVHYGKTRKAVAR